MNGICFSLTSFASPHTTKTQTPWIIDTCATDHMVCNTSYFSSITSTHSLAVKLSNGSFVSVTHLSTVHITLTLVLHNVLCVPFFTFNLILAKQLTSYLSCCFVFLSHFCFLQDLWTWTTTGMGEMKHGLYYLLAEAFPPPTLFDYFSLSLHKIISISTVFWQFDLVSDLWHCRIGHTPISKLLVIKDPMIKHHIFSISDTSPCHICPIAKHHWLSLLISTHKSTTPFALVHCDILGPNSWKPMMDPSIFFL